MTYQVTKLPTRWLASSEALRDRSRIQSNGRPAITLSAVAREGLVQVRHPTRKVYIAIDIRTRDFLGTSTRPFRHLPIRNIPTRRDPSAINEHLDLNRLAWVVP